MNNPTQQMIEALAKEKGIEPEVIIAAMEDAVLTASRKYYKTNETNENLRTRFNVESGQVELFAVKRIVDEVTTPAALFWVEDAMLMFGADAGVEVG
jgi:N utilization substance protein A